MTADAGLGYWRQRWETGQTAFHEGKPNDLLVEHAALLAGAARVLVPLAGKSHDLHALAAAGHDVVGVEGVELACRQFFDEARLPYTEAAPGRFRARGGRIELVRANFFDAARIGLGTFDAVWDRAALIAVDPADRARYADVIRALVRPRGRVLVVTFAYDQSLFAGPPWSLDAAALRALFLPRGFVATPVAAGAVAPNEKLRAAGVRDIREELVLLTRTG